MKNYGSQKTVDLNKIIEEASLEEIELLKMLIQTYSSTFDPKKIKIVPFKQFQINFEPYREKYWLALGRDIYERRSMPIDNDTIGFVTSESIDKRNSYVLESEVMSVFAHEAIHLMQHNKIFPEIYFKNILNARLIEGITEYLTKDIFFDYNPPYYQKDLNIILYAIQKNIITHETLKKFNFEGVISNEISKLYELFLVKYIPKTIINIFTFLFKYNHDIIDIEFLDLIKVIANPHQNIINAVIDYLKYSNESEIKKEFVSHLDRFFYSRDLLKDWKLPENVVDAIIMILKKANYTIDEEQFDYDKILYSIKCVKNLKNHSYELNKNNPKIEKELQAIDHMQLIAIEIYKKNKKPFPFLGIFIDVGTPIEKIEKIIIENLKQILKSDDENPGDRIKKLSKISNQLSDHSHSDLIRNLRKYIDFLATSQTKSIQPETSTKKIKYN